MVYLFALLISLSSAPCASEVDAFSCDTFGEPGTTSPSGVAWFETNCSPDLSTKLPRCR